MGLRLSEVFTKRRQMEIMISCSRNVAQNGIEGKGGIREKKNLFRVNSVARHSR